MEPIRQFAAVEIEDRTQVAVARRAVFDAGQRLGVGPEAISRAEIVAVELANNVVQHAGRGRILVGSTVDGSAIQIVAIDHGPGIPNVERAMQDGYSTAATPGLGLGAARRQSRDFDLYTQPGKGTVASACIGDDAADHAGRGCSATAALSTAMHGETLNGDSWATFAATALTPEREIFLLVDGLGHGLYASEAAHLAVSHFDQILKQDAALSLTEILQRMHVPMHATRGAAIALASVDHARSCVVYCGVGNIGGVLCAPDSTARSLVSHNGTLGHQMRRLQEFHYPFTPGSLLLMHSDGLFTHWKLAEYPNLLRHEPATIAGVLYRDASRGHDDATILVARVGAANG